MIFTKAESVRLKLGTYLLISSSLVFIFEKNTLAQSNIVPDRTLGTENSVVNPNSNNLPMELITGGAQRGQNLFHSFQEFNVGEGRGAYFAIPNADITNILSRVTGSNVSEILGTLGTIGESQTNLFLINPNGIVFGENASLDVGGSFIATTASSVQFGKRGFFSAIDPNVPSLLTVQPSAFFFNQMNSGIIQNNSVASAQSDLTESLELFGLRVPDGESLLLLGGNVEVNSGGIVALDGAISIGAVKSGTVALERDDNFHFSVTEDLVRGNISLTDGASLLSSGENGGSIAIKAKNIELLANSRVETGILSNLGSLDTQANDIELDATGIIAIESSSVFNRVSANATGNGGDLIIDAQNLSVTDGAQIGGLTFGTGNTGDVIINASESIQLDSGDTDFLTGIFAQILEGGQGNVGKTNITTQGLTINNNARIGTNTFGTGDAGNIELAAESIAFTNGALIDTRTLGVGNGGNVTVNAVDFSLDASSIFTAVTGGSIGDAGTIEINVDSLVVTNGASISSSTFGRGDAADVIINAQEAIEITGTGNDFFSAIFTEVAEIAEGNAGNIDLSTRFLTVSDGARLTSSSFGRGNAGKIDLNVTERIAIAGDDTRVRANVGSTATEQIEGGDLTINTKQLLITDGAQVSVTTFGRGNAGDLRVSASESVELKGEGNFPGGLFAQVDLTGEGEGGNLTIGTPYLSISDGSKVQVATFGRGDAGELLIRASKIDIFNTPEFSDFTTGIFGSVEIAPRTVELPEGEGGSVTILTEQLSVVDGGKISVDTKGIGNAGNLSIVAEESIVIKGVDLEPEDGVSFIGGNVSRDATGNGGSVNLETGNLLISDRGEAAVSSLGNGMGGNLNIRANFLTLDNAAISAETASNNGGNINLQITDLLLLDAGSKISTTAGTAQAGGNGGNIDLNTEFIVAFPNGNNDITANAFTGSGGNINITAESIFGLAQRSSTPPNTTNDIDASSEFGLDGEISIKTPDVDPARGLSNLPTDLIDVSRLIAKNCLDKTAEEKLNQFIITGRGGLPVNPEGIFSGDATLSADWVSLPEVNGSSRSLSKEESSDSQPSKQIIEAQGWIVGSQGQIILTAKPTQSQSQSWLVDSSCRDF